MAEGVELATAYVSVVVEGSRIAPEIRRQFGQVGAAADRAGRDSGRRFSGGVRGVLSKAGGLGAALGIGKVIKDSVTLEASFSKTMAQVGAATGGATDALSKLAIKLGADTQFSANEASGAMLELAKSGISTSEIMGGALSGTLLLASAGSTDLGTAATIASNAMNTFGLKGKDMTQIAAALAGGANASSASVESLGQGLQQVGPGAKNAGLSLQQTVGVLSAFDAAGIKGSDAGTSLKTMLTRLVPATKASQKAMDQFGLSFVDSKGNIDSVTTVADKLQKQLGGLSEEQRSIALTQIFGSDATRAATVLLNEGSVGIAKYIKATKDQGAAQRLAKANMSGTAGALERLSGSIETAELTLGKVLAPTVNKFANFLSDEAVPAITGFIQGMQEGTGAGGQIASALKDVYSTGKRVTKFFNDLPKPVKEFGVKGLIALAVVVKLSRALGPTTAAIGRFGSGMAAASTRTATLSRATASLKSGAATAAGAGGLLLLVNSTHQASKGMGTLEGALGGAALGFALGGPIGALIGGAGGGLLGLARSGHHAAAGITDSEAAARKAVPPLEGLSESIDGVTGAYSKMAKSQITAALQAAGVPLAAQTLNLNFKTVVDAALGVPSAIKQVDAAIAKANGALQDASQFSVNLGRGMRLVSGEQTAAGEAAAVLSKSLGKVTGKAKEERTEALNAALATGRLGKVLKGIPDNTVIKIGTEGQKQARADIVELASRGKGLSDKQITMLLKVANFKATKDQIAAIQRAADKAARDRTFTITPKLAGSAISAAVSGGGGGGSKGSNDRRVVQNPSLYIPGTPVPRVATTAQPAQGTAAGQRMTLVVGEQEFDAYVDYRNDGRFAANTGLQIQNERAFG